MPTTKTHVLRERDYDGDPIVGTFATAKQADAIRAALGQSGDEEQGWGRLDYYVDTVPLLPADLAVEDLGTVYGWQLGWYWDGTVRGDGALDPERLLKLHGLPDGYESDPEVDIPPDRATVYVKADETNYTLGAWATITGFDEAAVKAQADECRAGTQDVAAFVVDCWKVRGKVPSWVWDRDENQGLLDRLRAAGIQ